VGGLRDRRTHLLSSPHDHLPRLQSRCRPQRTITLKLGAGPLNEMHRELVDTRATKFNAVVYTPNDGIMLSERSYDQGKCHLFGQAVRRQAVRPDDAYAQ